MQATTSPTHDRGIGTSDRAHNKLDDYSGPNSPMGSKKEPFLLQIEINTVEDLVEHQAFQTEPICQNHKDTHMNIYVVGIDQDQSEFEGVEPNSMVKGTERFEEVYLLTSFNKNISVFFLHEKQYLYNISIDNKEMACSR